MRLIDADELLKLIPHEEMCSRFVVANAPTIDPQRKTGHWKFLRNGNAICSECGFEQVSAYDFENWDNFCHHCGADMRGENYD